MMTMVIALALAGLAVTLGCDVLAERVSSRWNAASEASVRRLSEACSEMLMPIDAALARRVLLALTLGAALIGWFSAAALWQRVPLAIAFGVAGYHAPGLGVRALRARRGSKIDEQFAPALVLMASGLQAGLSLPQALELAVRESPSPFADELALVVKELRLGTRFEDALRVLPRRLPGEDVRMAVDAILTLKETGGDLVSSFQVIAETIVERRKVEGRIRVITAEGTLQGIVMCLIPPAMLVLFSFADAASTRPIFGHPLGWVLLALVGALNTFGFILMRRVARVDV